MSKDSKAIQPKGKLLSFHPTGEYYFAKGLKAYGRRDFYKSKKFLERAAQLEPYEPMIHCQLAIVCTELGDYQQSNMYLHEILEELDEHMFECHYFLANNYAHLGLFKDAYTHAQTYLKLEPDGEFTADAEDLLDLLMLEAEENDENLYEEDDLIVKQEQARNLLETGQFPHAIELLEEVISSYPEYWSAYNNLALAYFYLGDANKANSILEDVLEKNNGNLHALCNKLVFAHYQRKSSEVSQLKGLLMKVQPMLMEHQYKLAASFALVGEYELAYAWLRKLQRKGFEGDGPFYYWLSHSAFHTGKEAAAKQYWKKVLELSPEKDGHAPWENLEIADPEQTESIETYLNSRQPEERLFGLFIAYLYGETGEELMTNYAPQNSIEKDYLEYLLTEKSSDRIAVFHQAALALVEHHSLEIHEELFKLLFQFACIAENHELPIVNTEALAAAIEYTWKKNQGMKVTQSQLSKHYEISVSTLQKYAKLIKGHI